MSLNLKRQLHYRSKQCQAGIRLELPISGRTFMSASRSLSWHLQAGVQVLFLTAGLRVILYICYLGLAIIDNNKIRIDAQAAIENGVAILIRAAADLPSAWFITIFAKRKQNPPIANLDLLLVYNNFASTYIKDVLTAAAIAAYCAWSHTITNNPFYPAYIQGQNPVTL